VIKFTFHVLSLATAAVLIAGCPDTGPEYKEPPIGSPHGTVKVEPVREGKGGGLRSIDSLLVFPREATAEDMPSWKYREWRVKPGMREIEIFGMGNFIRRVVRVREGKRILFRPEKYGDKETRGNRLLVGVYAMSEEDIE
jgi:hypothetical protein